MWTWTSKTQMIVLCQIIAVAIVCKKKTTTTANFAVYDKFTWIEYSEWLTSQASKSHWRHYNCETRVLHPGRRIYAVDTIGSHLKEKQAPWLVNLKVLTICQCTLTNSCCLTARWCDKSGACSQRRRNSQSPSWELSVERFHFFSASWVYRLHKNLIFSCWEMLTICHGRFPRARG